MIKSKQWLKDVGTLILDVIGFEKFLYLLVYMMILSFLIGIIVGLN